MIGSIIGTGLGLAGNIAGLIGSAKANKERQKLINSRRADIQNWFDKEYNQDFLATSENKSAMKHLSDKIREKQLAQENTNAIMGGSDESAVAQKGENTRTYADFVNNMAAKATDSKDSARHDYMAGMANVDSQQQALNQEKGNNWLNFGKMANTAGSVINQADAMGAFDKARQPNIDPIKSINATSVAGAKTNEELVNELQNKIKL